MGQKMVGEVSDNVLGTLEDIIRKIRKGRITPDELKRFAKKENPFMEISRWEPDLIISTQKLLSKCFGKRIEVDSLPEEFTEENLKKWGEYNLKPIFLPDEEILKGRKLKNWVLPPDKFYKWIEEKKIAADSAVLRRGWCLADFTPSVDYEDGIQVYPNDPLASVIERLRKKKKVGKSDKTPIWSRFAIIPQNEWPLVIAALVDEELKIQSSKEKRLERYIEFLVIGNIYDKNRGKFNTWEWFADDFEDSNQLYGGYRGSGGLADVNYSWSGYPSDDIAGRPLVSFVK